jgi:hypothetical protein
VLSAPVCEFNINEWNTVGADCELRYCRLAFSAACGKSAYLLVSGALIQEQPIKDERRERETRRQNETRGKYNSFEEHVE